MGKSVESLRIKPRQLWIIPMVFFVAQQSCALGLGDIQVNSYLGEPLKAQVALIELANAYESSLKVRLASPEEYQKNGYAYPYDFKFKFAIVNENGKQPMVHISTLRAIDDPYLSLLLEVASPSGKIIKIFTFLIDPSPDFPRAQSVVQSVLPTPASQPEIIKPEPGIQSPAVSAPTSEPAIQHRQPGMTKAMNRVLSVPHAGGNKRVSAQSHHYISNLNSGALVSGKLSLSLSTSLSISSNDPSLPLSPRENNDVLQEELIAKEKTLKELNSQIAEMQTLIKGLQIKLSLTTESAVSAADVLPQSGTAAVSQVEPAEPVKVKVVTPVVVAEVSTQNNLIELSKSYIKELLVGLAVIIFGGLGFYWWRKRKLESGWIPGGLFDDLSHTHAEDANKSNMPNPKEKEEVSPAKPRTVTTKTLTIGEQSMKVPAYKEQKVQSTLPPEYDLLEEADIYLRFGHDKLAEDVLRDAIKINPANPDIYMTLLGIFDTRGDTEEFEKTALELKGIADEDTWKKVAEMGKKLDIDNPLYG